MSGVYFIHINSFHEIERYWTDDSIGSDATLIYIKYDKEKKIK